MNENDIHKAIVNHLRYRGTSLMVPMHLNNTPRSARHGAHLKSMGLLKGAPDMVYACNQGVTLWHEIKTEKGRISPEQAAVHQRLRELGHMVLVTYGLDNALDELVNRAILMWRGR